MKKQIFRRIGMTLYHLIWVVINVPFFCAATAAFLVVGINMPMAAAVEWVLAYGPSDLKFDYARDFRLSLIVWLEFIEYIVDFGRYIVLGWNEWDDDDWVFDPLTAPGKVMKRIMRYNV